MANFPRSVQQVSAQGLNVSLGRVSKSDLPTGVSAEALKALGGAARDKGQEILQREGETLAIKDFAEFQRSELLRFNETKQASSENPEGFTERFMEESQKNFDELSGKVANKFYTSTMNGRFAGLSNSFVHSATSFEARQKGANRRARYTAAVGSYSSTVFDDPTQLGAVVNLAKGDAAAAVNSGIFGSEGAALAESSAKKIATSAIMGVTEKSPQDLNGYIEDNDLGAFFNEKELSGFRKQAQTNFRNIPKVELADKQMNLLSRKNDVMDLYIDGQLSLGAIDNMSELSDKEKAIARTLAIGDVKQTKDPEKLASLMSDRAALLDGDIDLSLGAGLEDLVKFQNDVYEALGTDINNTEAKSLLKGTTDGIDEALERDTNTIGAKVRNLLNPLLGTREMYPEEKAIAAINNFAEDRSAGEKRSLLRSISRKLGSIDEEAFDDSEMDDNGNTQLDRQVNIVIQSELSKRLKGLQQKTGTVNRTLGSDGEDGVVTDNKATAKADVSIVPDAPKNSFKTVEEAEASGVKGIVLIGGRRARID